MPVRSNHSFVVRVAALLFVVAGSFVFGQTPTYQIRLKEVNSTPIIGAGAASFEVAPGDRLLFEVTLRDWSPSGEMAAAVQAELESISFNSGEAGWIRPVAYDVTTLRGEPNRSNATIDQTNPNWIHYGNQTLSFASSNTVDPGYRWISVLFGKVGPISRQNGTEKYIGSLRAEVSRDAKGTFKFMLKPGQDHCGLLTFDQTPIAPIDVVNAEITVKENPVRRWMVSSSPSHGSVDARPGKASGTRNLTIRLSDGAEEAKESDFSIKSDSGETIKIKSLRGSARQVRITLEKPLPAETWTTITHLPSNTSARLGRMEGDVNEDGVVDFVDLDSLVASANTEGAAMPMTKDLDGNGRIGGGDVVRLINKLFGNQP